MVVRLYLNLVHVTLAFSLALIHQHSNSRLQHLAFSHISISYISILSSNQHHHSRFNHFKIYFVDNEFEKTY
jgi:hypothetical protein